MPRPDRKLLGGHQLIEQAGLRWPKLTFVLVCNWETFVWKHLFVSCRKPRVRNIKYSFLGNLDMKIICFPISFKLT
jgi:hypothetical protein